MAGPIPLPSCADWLAVVEPHLFETLVTAAARRKLEAVGRLLPGDCLTALEARLAAGSERIDLSLRLTDPVRAPVQSARFTCSRLERFLTRWSCLEPELGPVRSVWLELDLDRQPHGLPDPVICAEVRAGTGTRWLLDVLLPALDGRPPGAARRRWIDRCLGRVPKPGELLYVFSLGARRVDATRLEFQGIEPAAMAAYLEAVGAADTARRAAELAPLVSGCDRYHLSVEIGEEISPRIGIEASFRRLPHREPGWARLVESLTERGLCSPAKRDALFTWPGWDSPRTAPASWPAGLRRPGNFCARCLSHVKLVSLPDREPEAKAYLLFEHLERPLACSLDAASDTEDRGARYADSETSSSPASSRVRSA